MSLPVLSRPLVLEAPQRVPDGAGGYEIGWAPLGTLWAEVASGTGREAAIGGAATSRLALKITVRAAPQGAPSRPLPDQRFRDGARIYTILAVSERDRAGHYLVCHAQEETVA